MKARRGRDHARIAPFRGMVPNQDVRPVSRSRAKLIFASDLQPTHGPRVWIVGAIVGRAKQLDFPSTNWGGRRRGAGRKPSGPLTRVTHARRPKLPSRVPIHVTLRLVRGAPSLRTRLAHRVVVDALLASSRRGFRVIDYALLRNHVHLLREAQSELVLSRGTQGLCIRLSRRLKRAGGRRGRVFDDHYHAHQLRTPTEARNALRHVHENARHHGLISRTERGPFSSARWSGEPGATSPCPRPRTWLLSEGWRLAGSRSNEPQPRTRRRSVRPESDSLLPFGAPADRD